MTKGMKRISLGFTSCYVLPCKEGYLLADTGPERAYRKFRKALRKSGIDYENIRYLLLTHHHDDHAGFAARVADETGCVIIAHQEGVRGLKAGRTENTMKPLSGLIKIGFSFFRFLQGNPDYPSLDLSDESGFMEGRKRLISGDDDLLLNEIGVKGRILHTPGHTGDSISILMENGDLIAGDVVMNLMKSERLRYHPIYAEDLAQLYDSWRKIIDQGVQMIYPSHGKPFPASLLLESRYERRDDLFFPGNYTS